MSTLDIIKTWLTKASERVSNRLLFDWIYDHFTSEPDPTNKQEILHLALKVSEIAIGGVARDPLWDQFATAVIVIALHELTPSEFSECCDRLYRHVDEKQNPYPRITNDVHRLSFMSTGTRINNTIQKERDFDFDYQGIRQLLRTYLIYDTNEMIPVETPQYMYMRVSCGLYPNNIEKVLQVYEFFSTKKISHATPWYYYLGTPTPNIASCYLYNTGITEDEDRDSIVGFYDTLKATAIISSKGGGCGFNVHEVRAEGTLIRGSGGTAVGINKLLKQFDVLSDYVDQGRRRPAAIAVYMEPWHAEIENFLNIRLKSGDPSQRVFFLNTALWIPDIFMRRAANDEDWPLFCPHKNPGLNRLYGDEFEKLFLEYEQQGRANKVVKAREVFDMICISLADNGYPYIMFKDTINRCDNQNLGTIENSNLCVAGDTKLWTQEKGPIDILNLIPSKTKTYEEEQHASFDKKLEELRSKLPPVYDEEDPQYKDIEDHIQDLEMAKKALPIMPRITEPTPVHVFTGETWVKVTPAKTQDSADLIRIETSHGVRMDVTPEHEWVLENGDKIRTKELQVGQRLRYTRPIIHKPSPEEDITEKEAFMLGAVYGYGLRMKGSTLHDNIHLNLSAKVMQLRRSTLMPKALDMFDYDEKAIRSDEEFKDVDHDTFVIVRVPPKCSQMRTLFQASIEKRMAWVAGYITVTEGGRHMHCVTCYKMLRPVVDMFRSTGEHVKMIPIGRRGQYLLCPVNTEAKEDDRDVPMVTMKHILNTKEPVYCVSSKYGKACFEGGQVTGNCAEIVQYNDPKNIAVCVLGAVVLDAFVQKDGSYDFEGLHEAVAMVVENCDQAIDIMNYPLHEMEQSNKNTRPMGVGVMGFHTMLQKMGLPWVDDSGARPNQAAREHCSKVHETIYHAAIEKTCDLCDQKGPHPSFYESKASRGCLHFDLMRSKPEFKQMYDDWDMLRLRASKGRRNSLLVAMMPTASTSIICGKSEGRTPIQSNIFKSRTKTGEFVIVNQFLVKTLQEHDLWTPEIRAALIGNKGSVKGIGLPKHIEHLFATAWEIPQSVVLDFAHDAQFYTDQSMSNTMHCAVPTPAILQKIINKAWKSELKTGIYYLRSRPVTDGIRIDQSAVDPSTAVDPTSGCSGGACAL
jgi:ribonucleotide reductase alpha subunit